MNAYHGTFGLRKPITPVVMSKIEDGSSLWRVARWDTCTTWM